MLARSIRRAILSRWLVVAAADVVATLSLQGCSSQPHAATADGGADASLVEGSSDASAWPSPGTDADDASDIDAPVADASPPSWSFFTYDPGPRSPRAASSRSP